MLASLSRLSDPKYPFGVSAFSLFSNLFCGVAGVSKAHCLILVFSLTAICLRSNNYLLHDFSQYLNHLLQLRFPVDLIY